MGNSLGSGIPDKVRIKNMRPKKLILNKYEGYGTHSYLIISFQNHFQVLKKNVLKFD